VDDQMVMASTKVRVPGLEWRRRLTNRLNNHLHLLPSGCAREELEVEGEASVM
jgi:hypothetical protein